MIRAMHTAASGMIAQQNNVDVISNNLANVNTTGFRKSRVEFEDLIYQTYRTAGGTVGDNQRLPTGIQIGEGVRTVSTEAFHDLPEPAGPAGSGTRPTQQPGSAEPQATRSVRAFRVREP